MVEIHRDQGCHNGDKDIITWCSGLENFLKKMDGSLAVVRSFTVKWLIWS